MGKSEIRGYLYVLIGSTLWGVSSVVAKYSLFISPMKIITGGYSLKIWIAFLYIAIFSTLIPFGLYFKGVERIRATRANITSTWEPVVAGYLAYLVLAEVLHPLQVLVRQPGPPLAERLLSWTFGPGK
jgi:drug/metabolite transporter (DMT)-like permease